MGLRSYTLGFILGVLAGLLAAIAANAQPLPAANASASLTSTSCPGSGCVSLGVSGRASLAVQVTGTWVGTITVEGSVDGATYQALNVTAINGTSAVTTTTGNGVWVGAVGGLASVRARMSAFTSGTAVVSLQGVEPGGGAGGGGGGGSASDVTIHDPSVTTQKVAVNASGQMSITCANCSGSGASAVDNSAFTAGATSGAPAMGFYHSTIDTVTDGDTATIAIDSKRNAFEVIRDAAGNARGANVTATNALKVDASGSPQPTGVTQKQTFSSLQSGATANGNGVAIGTDGYESVTLDVSCTGCAGGTTLNFEADGPDVVGFVPVFATQIGTNTIATTTTQAGASLWTVNTTGLFHLRVRISAYSAGNITIDAAAYPIGLAQPVVNANVIGTVPVSGTFWQATQPVSGTFWQATQPVSGTVTANQGGTWTVQPGNTANTTAWKVDGSAVTQPVSGTVTANAGSGTFNIQANASTNVAQLAGTATSVNSGTKDAGTLRVTLATDQVQLTNALKVDGSAVTQPVSGTVTANQGGTWTVQPGNTANTTAWKVDGSAVTQPVSGTFWQATQPVSGTVTSNQGGAPWADNVTQFGGTNLSTGTGTGGAGIPRVTVSSDSSLTANAGTNLNTSALALSATQTSGAQKTQIVDGSGNVIASTSNNLNVQCANCSGSGASATDGASFTAGVSVFAPVGGEYNDNTAALAVGTQAMSRQTAYRAEHVNLRDSNGFEEGTQNNPQYVADLALVRLLKLMQQGTRLSGSFGAIGSIGDALKVYPTVPQDPCMSAAKGNAAISQTATTRYVVGQPGMRIYGCYARVVAGTAEIFSFTEGTGAACATGTLAVTGSTTAANGESYAANGGMSAGNGAGTVLLTTKPGDDLCLAQSTANRLSGNLTYVIAP